MVALCKPPADWVAGEIKVLNTVAPPMAVVFEPVGRAFNRLCVERHGKKEVAETKEGARKSQTKASPAVTIKIKDVLDADLDDYYGLLGLGDVHVYATQDQIKQYHRQVSLLCHPDKNPGKNREAVEERYKAIQSAYATLSDVFKRRHHDSQLDFDDSLPSVEVDEKDFYTVYRPVFKLNARFSSTQPVPDLGNDDTSDDEVNAFYEFWFGFKSWRDFSFLGEHNLEEAQNRDEKRWMVKKNKAAASQATKDEVARIRKLTDNAFDIDPRIKRMREREKKEKLEKKNKKKLKKKQEQQERQAKQHEKDNRLKEQKQKSAKKAAEEKRTRDEGKRAHKKLRAKFRKFCKAKYDGQQTDAKIELICTELSHEDLQQLMNAMESSHQPFPEAVDRIKQAEIAKQKALAIERRKKEAKKKQKKAEERAEEEWSHSELSLLAKAVRKYPGGSAQRWQHVSKLVVSRTPKQCIAKTKDLSKKKVASVNAGEAFQMYKSDMDRKEDMSPETTSNQPTKSENLNLNPSAVAETDVWSVEQQAALEKGLKMLKQFSPQERWDKIAAMVEGKTKKDCVKRFKKIKADILARKKGMNKP